MKHYLVLLAGLTLLLLSTPSFAIDGKCTPADVAKYEYMIGGGGGPVRPGQYRTDPRFGVTLHFLGVTFAKNGACLIAVKPVR